MKLSDISNKEQILDEASLATMRDYFAGQEDASDPLEITKQRMWFDKNKERIANKRKEFRSPWEFNQWLKKYNLKALSDGSIVKEFAPDDGSGDEDDTLLKYARMWYNGDLGTQQQVEQALARAGWEIGELESEEGGAFVVQAGDENGDSYIGFAVADLTEQQVAEMDSQGYTGSRDRKSMSKYGSRDDYKLGDPETTLGSDSITKPADVIKQGARALDNAFNYAEDDWSKDFERRMKKDVKEAHPNSKIYDKCWDGYKKVPGKKRGEEGSCVKESTSALSEAIRTVEGMRSVREGEPGIKRVSRKRVDDSTEVRYHVLDSNGVTHKSFDDLANAKRWLSANRDILSKD